MVKPSLLSWQLPSVLIFFAVVHVALSQHSPSPSTGTTAPDSSPISSPPSPPPSEPPSPAPTPSETDSPSPSPSSSSADLSHTGVLDENASEGGKSEGTSIRRKVGVVLAVIVCAVLVVIGGMVYKKRQENIRRQRYAFSGRSEIQL